MSVSGGEGPYSYAWSNGGDGEMQSGLPSGDYTIVTGFYDHATGMRLGQAAKIAQFEIAYTEKANLRD